MKTISFTLPDKYESKKSQINGLINSLNGDFVATITKDGYAYSVDFEIDDNADEFNLQLSKIIPEIHKY